MYRGQTVRRKGSATVPLYRAKTSSYRLSIVTMSLSAAVWPQFWMQSSPTCAELPCRFPSGRCSVRYNSVTISFIKIMTVITRGNRLQPEVRRWLLEIGSMVGHPIDSCASCLHCLLKQTKDTIPSFIQCLLNESLSFITGKEFQNIILID